MRILWFTNILMPDACGYVGRDSAGGSGWWMVALLDRLKRRGGLKLAVVAVDGWRDLRFEANGVTYFVVKQSFSRRVLGLLGHTWAVKPDKSLIAKYAAIAKDWEPDVIHVHGTEKDFGCIRAWGLTEKPVAVSIQGLMAMCTRKAYGDLLPQELDSVIRRLTGLKASGQRRWAFFRERMGTEELILRSADMIFGRTEWDKAWAWAFCPGAPYRHVDDLMREEFFAAEPWSITSCQRHQIFCTSGPEPLKGIHVLLDALRRLRQVYPDVTLHVASGGFGGKRRGDYPRYVGNLVKSWRLEGAVDFLGWRGPSELAQQLRDSHCFVTPSFVENGCNALQEAMLVGTPCVATYTGGITSTIPSEDVGLRSPVGDAALLAWKINMLFQDDALAVKIGMAARAMARARHNPERVEAQLMRWYEELSSLGPRGAIGAPR